MASGGGINQSIFQEIWQLNPDLDRNALSSRIVIFPEVDSRDGPPSESIKRCDIALVGVPMQLHLVKGEQYNMEILQQDLIQGSGIGAAFDKAPTIFSMDKDIKIFVYNRRRKITDTEYQDLVERFLKVKGPDYKNPRK